MTDSVLPPEQYITRACEVDLREHGDSWQGAGYTRGADEPTRLYRIMLDVVRVPDDPATLLDLGCGPAHLLDLVASDPVYRALRYTGLDLSEEFLGVARSRHPGADFVRMNLLEDDSALGQFDYVVMNGLFNYRGEIPFEEMLDYWARFVEIAFTHCRVGLAFNVMSTLVEWQRDDLFHLPFDTLASVVADRLSPYFVIRHDYPTYEYTTYVYRDPVES